MRSSGSDSSTYIAFRDGTSSGSAQPVVETTAPSDSLASRMANWAVLLPSEGELAMKKMSEKAPRAAL